MPHFDNETIQLVIISVAAAAVVLQAVVLLAIYVGVKKAARSLQQEVEDLRSTVMPLIYTSREFCTRLAPKVEAATIDVAEMVHGLREHSAEVASTTTVILERLRSQTIRLDTMLTDLLDGVDRAGGFVVDAVSKPVRQLSSVLASIKAVVESLRNSSANRRATYTPDDNDPTVQ